MLIHSSNYNIWTEILSAHYSARNSTLIVSTNISALLHTFPGMIQSFEGVPQPYRNLFLRSVQSTTTNTPTIQISKTCSGHCA